jgi:hypothetical protein
MPSLLPKPIPESAYLWTSHYMPDHMNCNWENVKRQLLQQWRSVSEKEIEMAGPSRSRLARLISQRYGIAYRSVENYLFNFERHIKPASRG